MSTCSIKVYRSCKLVCSLQVQQPVVVGRRDPSLQDPPPVQLTDGENARLVVADKTETLISRSIFRLTPQEDGRFLIENINSSSSLDLANDASVGVGESREFSREIVVDIGGGLAVRVDPSPKPEVGSGQFRSLGTRNTDFGFGTIGRDGADDIDAGGVPANISYTVTKKIGHFSANDVKEISKMLRLALGVVQRAAGTSEFFQASVEATTEIVNLDHAMVLLRDCEDDVAPSFAAEVPEGWTIAAEHSKLVQPDAINGSSLNAFHVSSSLLSRVTETSSTVIHDPSQIHTSDGNVVPESLSTIECAVASPIMNHESKVLGVLYGYRKMLNDQSSLDPIEDHEATLIEILAGSLAGGIARRAQERLRVTLSEFFSPRVASLLESRPELMEGHDVEVSVLFCDIRGFSSVTEELGPQRTFDWVNDVMTELSKCVIQSDGVLVDYVGDELFAMWGAPGEQLDHATRAVETAREMLAAIETLRQRWKDMLPDRFGAGIGVNTGIARVGNVGSRQKFKYGPLGNSINVGSRLQSATKQFGVDCLVSLSSAAAANCLPSSRRLAKLTFVGINEPIDVYQIVGKPNSDWSVLAKGYEEALVAYEETRFIDAAQHLGNLMSTFPDDRPCRLLLSRVLHAMDNPIDDFTSVLNLNSK